MSGEPPARPRGLSFSAILGVFLWLDMLVYGPAMRRLLRPVLPPGDGTPQDDFPTRVQHAVAGYVRGQLLFSAIMGLSAGIALWLFGVPALAGGLAFDAIPFVSAAAWSLLAASVVYTVNVIRILRYAFLTPSSARP